MILLQMVMVSPGTGDFPYPISDLIKNLIPYFRPEALEPDV